MNWQQALNGPHVHSSDESYLIENFTISCLRVPFKTIYMMILLDSLTCVLNNWAALPSPPILSTIEDEEEASLKVKWKVIPCNINVETRDASFIYMTSTSQPVIVMPWSFVLFCISPAYCLFTQNFYHQIVPSVNIYSIRTKAEQIIAIAKQYKRVNKFVRAFANNDDLWPRELSCLASSAS